MTTDRTGWVRDEELEQDVKERAGRADLKEKLDAIDKDIEKAKRKDDKEASK